MERLLSVKDIAERYGVSRKTAESYIHRMVHMEQPLRVTMRALFDWEAGRMKLPDGDDRDGILEEMRRRVVETPLRIERRRD